MTDGAASASGRAYNPEQYDMLVRCSKAEDAAEWNDWRASNQSAPIHLEGAKLDGLKLRRVWLQNAKLAGASLVGTDLRLANLYKTDFTDANLESAVLCHAKLEKADMHGVRLVGANLGGAMLPEAQVINAQANPSSWTAAILRRAHICGSDLSGADLSDLKAEHVDFAASKFIGADLVNATVTDAYLGSADFDGADLRDADLRFSKLERGSLAGAKLNNADLSGTWMLDSKLGGADFTDAIVDGGTLMTRCTVDNSTNSTSVGLRNARIPVELRARLECNVRRFRWQRWRDGNRWHKIMWPVVRWFWSVSNYGSSTGQVLCWFFGLAALFAAIYWLCPSIVAGTGTAVELDCGRSLARSFYFSIVTMTTLGFGDVHAAPGNTAGYVILTAQVLLGYLMLAALVTRLSVLFQES